MIMNPTAIKHVVVDGHSLTLESFVAIARYNATVELAPSALEAMQKSRALAEKIAAEGRVAYGITTGFGEFQKVAVPKEMSNQLSTNLILSHCTAAGEPPSVTVRFADSGRPYDPLRRADPDITLSAEERAVGGLGILMVKKLMDETAYEYVDGKNVLTIKKYA